MLFDILKLTGLSRIVLMHLRCLCHDTEPTNWNSHQILTQLSIILKNKLILYHTVHCTLIFKSMYIIWVKKKLKDFKLFQWISFLPIFEIAYNHELQHHINIKEWKSLSLNKYFPHCSGYKYLFSFHQRNHAHCSIRIQANEPWEILWRLKF